MKVVFLVIDTKPIKEIIRETQAHLDIDQCVVIDDILYKIELILHHFDNRTGYELTCGIKPLDRKSLYEQ